MTTLNWEKVPPLKAKSTLWAAGSAADGSSSSAAACLAALLAPGAQLVLDERVLEERFARPKGRRQSVQASGSEVPKGRVTLLDQKRSNAVAFALAKINKIVPEGQTLREAILRVEESVLKPETLKMIIDILPTAEEASKLRDFSGSLDMLDKPEQMLLELAGIPRLEGRLRAIMFKAQFETDMSAAKAQVADLRRASVSLRGSSEMQALLQVVLSVGNALNGGTSKGCATGFRLNTLLKLAELKGGADKKTTLLHYTFDVARQRRRRRRRARRPPSKRRPTSRRRARATRCSPTRSSARSRRTTTSSSRPRSRRSTSSTSTTRGARCAASRRRTSSARR